MVLVQKRDPSFRGNDGMWGTEDRHGWVRLAVAVCTTERSALRSGRVKPKHN